MRLADCFYELDDFDSAIEKYGIIIDYPGNLKYKNIARYNRALCWREKDNYAQALKEFKCLDISHAKTEYFIGEVLYLTSFFEESYQVIRSWLDKNPEHNDGIRTLARVANQLDKHEDSLCSFRKLFALGHRDREVLDGMITELNWLDKINELKVFLREHLDDKSDLDGSLREKAKDIIEDFESVQRHDTKTI